MGAFIDLRGRVFGRLTVLAQAGHNVHRCILWLAQCECGNKHVARGDDLRNGKTRSCGCLLIEDRKTRVASHRRTKTPEYRTWMAMKDRCCRSSNAAWERYGGRGIRVCDRWLHSFENFYADMGDKPTPKHSIDRINNNGDYEPGNCRWATTSEQAANTSASWRPDEDRKICDGIAAGLRFPQLMRLVGRSYGSVSARAYKLGLRSGQPRNTRPARDSV